jgi:hypothetical protein
MHDRFRREQHHAERREREIAQRQRRAVDHHGDEHDRRHDEGALRRDLRAREITRADGSKAYDVLVSSAG